MVTDSDDDPVDERAWHAFAAASARAGVSSTLSIPLMKRGPGLRRLNLYGGTPQAFDGHHEELAALYGGWAGGAVTNADLSSPPWPGPGPLLGCWPTPRAATWPWA